MSTSVERSPEHLHARVERWLAERGLSEEVRRCSEPAVAWGYYCSPAEASLDQLELAALDLALWLFAVDDYAGPDADDHLGRCLEQLRGHGEPEAPVERARSMLLDRMCRAGATTEGYLRSRERYVEAIAQRNRYREGRAAAPSFDAYLELRETTIYVEQWVEVWGLVSGFAPCSLGSRQPRCVQAERAIAHAHILRNEARSLDRDREAGIPNLVELLSAREGCSVDESTRILEERYRVACARYDEARGPLGRDPTIPKAYLAVLDACRFGSAEAEAEARGRYPPAR